MNKVKNLEIKPFTFSEISSENQNQQTDFVPFSFQDISGIPFNLERPSDQTIREERTYESKNQFRIDEKVRASRGLLRQEKNDFEERVASEVAQQIQKIHDQAYREGFEQGREEGEKNLRLEVENLYNEKVSRVEEVLSEVTEKTKELIVQNKNEMYEFINRVTKWVILKEISNKDYLERLLEKLVLELNDKRNLIIKVGKANFSDMPEVISIVESRLGNLPNVRVEVVSEVLYPGIILESENSLIDGSLESVFKNIDKVFELVNPNE